MFNNAWRERTVGCLLVMAAVMIVVGGIVTFALVTSGVYRYVYTKGDNSTWRVAASGLALCVGGVLLGLGTLGYGVYVSRDRGRASLPRTALNVFIIAKTAYDDRGELIVFPDDYDAPLQYFVRVAFPDGRRADLKADKAMFGRVAEGVSGTLTFQGHWVRDFTVSGPRSNA